LGKGLNKVEAIVTTSWDDGHILDLKIADLLKELGLKGTFYVVAGYIKAESPGFLGREEVRTLISEGFEVGSHGYTHFKLTSLSLDVAKEELVLSKRILEDELKCKVHGFSYPQGVFNEELMKLTKIVGYEYARTMNRFTTRIEDPFKVGITVHAYPYSFRKNVKAIKFTRKLAALSRWAELGKELFNYVLRWGGVWHLAGHSWEIEYFNLWNELRELLEYVANRDGVHYVTNLEAVKMSLKLTNLSHRELLKYS